MGSDQDAFIKPVFPLVLGPCDGCGEDNEYSAHRLADYQKKGFKLTSFCPICLFKLREAKKCATAPERPDEEAKAMTV